MNTELEDLKIKEVSRALSNIQDERDARGWVVIDNRVITDKYIRLIKNINKYTPQWDTIYTKGKTGVVCTLVGSSGGVVATGIAWRAPVDKENYHTGKLISYSRAIRYLVAKRMGITS